jgi:hypothetical protein
MELVGLNVFKYFALLHLQNFTAHNSDLCLLNGGKDTILQNKSCFLTLRVGLCPTVPDIQMKTIQEIKIKIVCLRLSIVPCHKLIYLLNH